MSEAPKCRITIVEDDPATRKLLERQLADAGYETSAFGDGRAALQAICAMGNGIVLADWSMPEMDGIELCRALRELQDLQALGNVYYILLTAHRTKDKVVEGLAAGANDYLTKPYHPGELLARVQVGQRMLRLQEELLRRTVEGQKINAQMAVLANKLEHIANTDVLTELPNRRCLFERLEEAWVRARRDHTPLACLILDVDHFKKINDAHGHAAGDAVLRAIAAAVRDHAPRPELSGRFGGEEFVIVFPAAATADAATTADALRAHVAGQQVRYEQATIHATVSGGIAELTPAMGSVDELIIAADAMLYLAKEHGRNQIWVQRPDGSGQRAGVGPSASDVPPPPDHPPASGTRRHSRQASLQSPHANPDHER
ncbi:MAG TPA: diguanylate cyclase [Phycisphaerae bacterium]|nr:diguanylate cyclase [Phycisphaerae bacterium]